MYMHMTKASKGICCIMWYRRIVTSSHLKAGGCTSKRALYCGRGGSHPVWMTVPVWMDIASEVCWRKPDLLHLSVHIGHGALLKCMFNFPVFIVHLICANSSELQLFHM